MTESGFKSRIHNSGRRNLAEYFNSRMSAIQHVVGKKDSPAGRNSLRVGELQLFSETESVAQ